MMNTDELYKKIMSKSPQNRLWPGVYDREYGRDAFSQRIVNQGNMLNYSASFNTGIAMNNQPLVTDVNFVIRKVNELLDSLPDVMSAKGNINLTFNNGKQTNAIIKYKEY